MTDDIITEVWLKDTCLLGHGESTCAFLILDGSGFQCAKGTGIETTIRLRLAEGMMGAKGDNCDGWNERVRA